MSNHASALSAYQKVGVESGVEVADPHQLVTMLLNGALRDIAVAKGHFQRDEIAGRGERISHVIGIIDGLRAMLDHDVGGELTSNLEALYEYMGRRLLEANVEGNASILDEVTTLFEEIRKGWEAIPVESRTGSVDGA